LRRSQQPSSQNTATSPATPAAAAKALLSAAVAAEGSDASPLGGLGAAAAAAASEMPRHHEDLLCAAGVPDSELQRSSDWTRDLTEAEVSKSLGYSLSVNVYFWRYHVQRMLTELSEISSRTAGGGGSEGSSSSSSSSSSTNSGGSSSNSSAQYMLNASVRTEAQLQRRLPPGAFKLLQHWPAVQLELLLLVKDVDHHMWLLPPVACMLQVCTMANMPVSDVTAVNSALIKPLLQLVLPRVQTVSKALRAADDSATATQASSSSNNSSGSSDGAQVGSSRGSSSRFGTYADLLETQLHEVLLEFMNHSPGGEQQLVFDCVGF
jgi:uncharacterized membrane protein YgcG